MPSELGAAFDADGYYLAVTAPADLSDLLNTTEATSPLTGPELSQSFCELAAAGKPPYLKITGELS